MDTTLDIGAIAMGAMITQMLAKQDQSQAHTQNKDQEQEKEKQDQQQEKQDQRQVTQDWPCQPHTLMQLFKCLTSPHLKKWSQEQCLNLLGILVIHGLHLKILLIMVTRLSELPVFGQTDTPSPACR